MTFIAGFLPFEPGSLGQWFIHKLRSGSYALEVTLWKLRSGVFPSPAIDRRVRKRAIPFSLVYQASHQALDRCAWA
jgi:hypothetical protein